MSLTLLCQEVIGRKWTVECGASTNAGFKNHSSLNLRYISPRFKWSYHKLTEEEEKHPEKFQNTRLMIEVLYTPLLSVLGAGFNVQSRLLNYKRVSLEVYGGIKFFFVPGPDFITIRYLKGGREFWYMNLGLICQLNLGVIAPFADLGGDGIVTIGTEVNFHSIYKKIKKKYRPPYLYSG